MAGYCASTVPHQREAVRGGTCPVSPNSELLARAMIGLLRVVMRARAHARARTSIVLRNGTPLKVYVRI